MSVSKTSETKSAACDAVVDRIDLGSLSGAGTLRIYNSDSTVLASLGLSNPAFADATDGTSLCNFIYDSTGITDGTSSIFWFHNRDGSSVLGGTVSGPGGGGNLVLSNSAITTDTTVSLTPGYYVVP